MKFFLIIGWIGFISDLLFSDLDNLESDLEDEFKLSIGKFFFKKIIYIFLVVILY